MIKANELKEKIGNEILQSISFKEYKLTKKYNLFVKQEGENKFMMQLEQIRWSDCFNIEIRYFICNIKVQEIFNAILKRNNFDYTMGSEASLIFNSPDGRQIVRNMMSIQIYSDDDVDAAIESIIDIYERVGKPYFERYNTLEKMEALFNDDPYCEFIADADGLLPYRYIHGLILSKLCNPARYKKLERIYDIGILKTSNDFLEDYYKMKSYLEQKFPTSSLL